MGKNGGKHRRGKAGSNPAEEAAGQEARKEHRKSKSSLNIASTSSDELSGPSKYLVKNTDEASTENKHALYQRAVQSPKGDISYLVKFFLTYIGGRVPLHLREDFCGTALICTEWLRPDVRRTATGLDLDEDALQWGAEHNVGGLPDSGGGRMCLLLGNVLQPVESAREIPCGTEEQAVRGRETTEEPIDTTGTERSVGTGPGELSNEEHGEGRVADAAASDIAQSLTRVGTDDVSVERNEGECSERSAPEAGVTGRQLGGLNVNGPNVTGSSENGPSETRASVNGLRVPGASENGPNENGSSVTWANENGSSVTGAGVNGPNKTRASGYEPSVNGSSARGPSVNGSSENGASVNEANRTPSANGSSSEIQAVANRADAHGSVNKNHQSKKVSKLHTLGADMICAFNYSTCCLHSRQQLLRYFHYARKGLSDRGGVFALDLYGGTSSECALRLKRRFGDFTYTWEQEEFDAVTRMTRISLHFRLEKTKKTIKNAFSYQWRLWTIPEVRECLLEAGFSAAHVWMREMPDLQDRDEDDEVEVDAHSKYVECKKFLQCDAWNAYVVAVS